MCRNIFIFLSFVFSLVATFPSQILAGCQHCVIGGQLEGKGTSGTFSGATLGKGKSSAGFLYSYRNWDTIDSGEVSSEEHSSEHEEEEAHTHNKIQESHYFVTVSHGVSERLDLSVQIPYVEIESRNTHDPDRLGKKERSTGMGDLILLGKYRFWERFFDAALIAGIKFPTGETKEKDGSGGRFEPEEQPGSGSFDPILGLGASKALGLFHLDSSVIYTIRTEGAQDYEFGNALKLNGAVSLQVAEWLKDIRAYLTLEANAIFEDKDKQEGETVSDTGATLLFLTPGLRVQGGDRWVAYVSAPLPAVQNRPSGHQDLDYSVLAGISFLF